MEKIPAQKNVNNSTSEKENSLRLDELMNEKLKVRMNLFVMEILLIEGTKVHGFIVGGMKIKQNVRKTFFSSCDVDKTKIYKMEKVIGIDRGIFEGTQRFKLKELDDYITRIGIEKLEEILGSFCEEEYLFNENKRRELEDMANKRKGEKELYEFYETVTSFVRKEKACFSRREDDTLDENFTRLAHYIEKGDMKAYSRIDFKRLIDMINSIKATSFEGIDDSVFQEYLTALGNSYKKAIAFDIIKNRERICAAGYEYGHSIYPSK